VFLSAKWAHIVEKREKEKKEGSGPDFFVLTFEGLLLPKAKR
jgi:hypothetical protein